ncbi:MAG: OsmC family protein [Hyphomicrobiaceae bacterium]
MHERVVTVVESGNGPYGQFVTSGRHVMGADEPESFGGHDTGPDPYEFVLAGLGACTAMTIRMFADRKSIPVKRVEVRLRHLQRASSGRDIKDKFERTITLEGDLTPEQRQTLLEIADRCPVSKTLKQSSEIVSQLAEGA